ncbi:aldehyde dehydrogenase family protein [Sphaerobacter thermophilus]|jgi:aldehyde dehydrogenase (NAD+)|uniref:Aldehyde Dehydrogenase n=1 Tax=Sphaerobacter thermophilus (strain ATCC 49802 / DSM 20745 / KCCM 41009 / NCIMB 13125 / S 6022) TaxID=479434 RepID=D1C924_SPHTD|nr:aldehyde dehydrogenase family protein [Sphaerobacter thermophilus]ACZ40317.1 Aldehyde Dehydrogenase [Sphaerobacter thermophilus DSM 20745]PZN65322.1 MAG: aldehyde dehydrogenase family protein [Sphaerobacter thermophilus]
MSAQVSETRYRNYIGGEWVMPSGAELRPNQNPADTREVLGEFPRSSEEDVARAVEAAAEALPGWRRTSGPQRSAILTKAAEILERRAQEIGEVLTREEGKTIGEGVGEVLRGVQILRFYAGEPLRPIGENYASANPDTFLYTERVPVGVVGVITPWNFPVAIPIWKLAPCLAYGNTAVFKPAELTPLTAHLITEVFAEAGLPPGVLNLVHGPGQVVGEALARHPKVNAITFTGSNAVGRHLYQIASARGAKVQLELGGKNPVVIAEDADLAQAVEIVTSGAMRSTGQKCTATSRVIVAEPLLKEFTEALVERAKSITVGPGIDPATYMGPLVSEERRESVLRYIEIGKQEGAKLLTGGEPLTGPEHKHGFFVAPTVFADVEPTMRIAQEEIFGPVVGVIRARSLDEAIEIANGVDFGLSASIITRDIRKAFHFIRSVEAGIVHVNSETAGAEPHVPFGGMKGSSSYSREQGRAAMEFFTQTKTVYLDLPPA